MKKKIMKKVTTKIQNDRIIKYLLGLIIVTFIIEVFLIAAIFLLDYKINKLTENITVTRVILAHDAVVNLKFKEQKENTECFDLSVNTSKHLAGLDFVLTKQEQARIYFTPVSGVQKIKSVEGLSLLIENPLQKDNIYKLGVVCVTGTTKEISSLFTTQHFNLYEYATGNKLSVEVKVD